MSLRCRRGGRKSGRRGAPQQPAWAPCWWSRHALRFLAPSGSV